MTVRIPVVAHTPYVARIRTVPVDLGIPEQVVVVVVIPHKVVDMLVPWDKTVVCR